MAHILGHPPPFDASSIAFVNANKSAGIMNKLDNPRYRPANLRGAQPSLRRLWRGQQVVAASVSQTRTVVDFRRP